MVCEEQVNVLHYTSIRILTNIYETMIEMEINKSPKRLKNLAFKCQLSSFCIFVVAQFLYQIELKYYELNLKLDVVGSNVDYTKTRLDPNVLR